MKINTSRKLLFTSLALGFFTLLSGFVINLLTGDRGLNEWLGAGTRTLVLSAVVVGVALLLLTYLQFKYSQTAEPVAENIEPDVKRLYDSLRERYQDRYEQKLDGRFEITLKVSRDWKSPDSQTIKERFNKNADVGEAVKSVRKAFEQNGRLLILGNPGAGKTVLLLKLALGLLGNVDLEGKSPLPVIFNLASWSYAYDEIEDWLLAVLVTDNGLSREFASALLRQGRIFFLLDGLDELARNEPAESAASKRAYCLRSLNSYLRYGRKAVICSRIGEFTRLQEMTGQDAPVSAKAEVLELKKKDILSALRGALQDDRSRTSAVNLLKIVRENGAFADALGAPFYFTTALEVFDFEILKKDGLPKDAADARRYLLESFVETKLRHTPNPHGFPHEKTKRWLRRLAELLEKHQQVTFELNDLRPADVKRTTLSFIFIDIFAGLIGRRKSNSRINTEDFSVWTVRPLLEWKNLKFILPMCLIFCALTSLVMYGLKGPVVYGGLFGFVLGLVMAVDAFCRRIFTFASLKTPYQRLMSGIFHQLVVATLIVLSPIYAFAKFVPFEFAHTWLFTALFVPLYGLTLSLFSMPLFRHLLIRFFLAVRGEVPYRLVTFLNYATALRILERDGGQWRFRHQELQDYFAAPPTSRL